MVHSLQLTRTLHKKVTQFLRERKRERMNDEHIQDYPDQEFNLLYITVYFLITQKAWEYMHIE